MSTARGGSTRRSRTAHRTEREGWLSSIAARDSTWPSGIRNTTGWPTTATTTSQHGSISMSDAPTEYRENSQAVHAHLGIMQSVIQRMASNSSSCMSWCIALVSDVLVLVADHGKA